MKSHAALYSDHPMHMNLRGERRHPVDTRQPGMYPKHTRVDTSRVGVLRFLQCSNGCVVEVSN